MFTLAHLSDPHLPSVPRARLREMLGKRAIGLANWHWRRRHEHRPEALDAVLSDMAAQRPDHIALTGDLVNVALPGEFVAARDFLSRVGPPARVTLVPGNHDAYVRATVTHAGEQWAEYMRGDDAAASFPFLRRRGGLALVALSTAVPTRAFRATGDLGGEQLARLDALLARLDAEGAIVVVLMHHPPTPFPHDRHKCLLDAAAFRAVAQRHRIAMILHGHMHVSALTWIDAVTPIPVFGVPSASMAKGTNPAGYNLYRFEQEGAAWRCKAISRAVRDGVIVEVGRANLTGSQ